MRRGHYLAMQVSLHAIVAAACGLAVWIATIWHVHSIWHPAGGLFMSGAVWDAKVTTVLLLYGPLGALLGAVVVLLEPSQDTSFRSALSGEARWLWVGILLGAAGAIGGGLLGEWLLEYVVAHRGPSADYRTTVKIGRALGTVSLGMVLGVALGVIDRLRSASNARLLAGALGGIVGGGLAALLFNFAIVSTEALTVLSLTVLALCIAAAIGSITFLQTKGFLVGRSGLKYGQGFSRKLLRDAPNGIGSGLPSRRSPKMQFKITMDQDIMPEHAEIRFDPRRKAWFVRRLHPSATELFLNSRRLLDEPAPLREGDIVTIGRTSFTFRASL